MDLAPTPPQARLHALGWSVGLFAVFALWDFSGLDLQLARWFGTSHGFALRDHWLFSTVLHEGARRLAWALQLALLLAIWWPLGVLRGLSRRERAHLFIASMLCLMAIAVFKQMSTTSCPWDLREFGGTAHYVPYWHWGVRDGGPGRCFPAGHASAALCFLPGYFWLRARWPRAATWWLTATLLAGGAIGLAQQVRGAHYLSHTLWTGWICWTIAAAYHGALYWRQQRPAPAPAGTAPVCIGGESDALPPADSSDPLRQPGRS